jgi:cellulose synthase/poly-beta-1,6-N-acetylglucosamine synthase-like glycosyltransferase
MAETVFWACLVLLAYHHVGYPPLLRILATRARRRARPVPPSRAGFSVAMVIPARNEAGVIARKLANCAALDWPSDRFEVVLVCDGCTDGTAAVAREALTRLPALRCRIVEHAVNQGKVRALNDAIGGCSADVVAISDASSLLPQRALARLVPYFSDPAIGVVCPSYRVPPETLAAERLYWARQCRHKADEAAVGAPMGAHGACYFVRRSLWAPLDADIINDDFVLPMAIVAKGYRAVYDLDVAATELEPTTIGQNVSRRIRIGAGNLQQVLRLPGLANPRRPGTAFVFLSGKGLRGVAPLLIVAAALGAMALALEGAVAFQILVSLTLVALGMAWLVLRSPREWPAWMSVPAYIVQSYVAAAIGCFLLLSGRGGRAWSLSRSGSPTAPKASAAEPVP